MGSKGDNLCHNMVRWSPQPQQQTLAIVVTGGVLILRGCWRLVDRTQFKLNLGQTSAAENIGSGEDNSLGNL